MDNPMAIDSLVNHVPEAEQSIIVPHTVGSTNIHGVQSPQEIEEPETPTRSTRNPAFKTGSRKTKNSSKLAIPSELPDQELVDILIDVPLIANEHIVPLEVPLRIRRQYCEILEEHAQAIVDIIAEERPGIKLRAEIEEMVSELDKLVTHPDLIESVACKESKIDFSGDNYSYTRTVSSKFGFLESLLTGLFKATSQGLPEVLEGKTKDQGTIRIAIHAEQGQLFDILVQFLVRTGLPFTVLNSHGNHESYHDEIESNLCIMAVSNKYRAHEDMLSVDIIYPMDMTFDQNNKLVKILRGGGEEEEEEEAHVIYPWIWGSPQYVKACMPMMDNYVEQLRLLVSVLLQWQHNLGKGDSDFRSKATSISDWILDGFDEEFPVSPVKREIFETPQAILESRNKRKLDLVWEEHVSPPSKRRRLDSILQERVPAGLLPPADEISALREQVLALKETLSSQHQSVCSYEDNVTDYRRSLRHSNAQMSLANAEIQMTRMEKAELQTKLADCEKTANGLMDACDKALSGREDVVKKNTALKREKTALNKQLQQVTATLETAENKIVDLESRLQLARQIDDAGDEASASTSLSSTVFLQLNSENDTQRAEIASLKKRVQSSEGDRTYAIKMYQEASSRALESAQEISALQKEIDRLTPLAEGRPQLVSQDIDQSELEATRAALDKAIAEKEEAEEQLRRGNGRIGVSTRGQSSAPATSRSPRVAASPPRSRASSRQPASRASSPIRGTPGLRRGQGRLGEY